MKVELPVYCIDTHYNKAELDEVEAFDITLASIFTTAKIFRPYDLNQAEAVTPE